jgi:hypothetical protein
MQITTSKDWQLVPKRPDDLHIDGLAMLVAGKQALLGCSEDPELEDARICYLAMLAEAPQPRTGDELVSFTLVADWIGREAPTLLDAFTKEFKLLNSALRPDEAPSPRPDRK